jgi:toxin ParE1/3/4
MKYQLRIFPAAEADVDDAALFIAQDNLQAALRFYDAVDNTYRQIAQHPTRSPKYVLDHPELANLRKRSVAGFRNYLIFYQIKTETVDVIRVLHGAREIESALHGTPLED